MNLIHDVDSPETSAEYKALQGMFLALVYELNEAPDFPRRGLLNSLGKIAESLESDGQAVAARLLLDTQMVMAMNLGD